MRSALAILLALTLMVVAVWVFAFGFASALIARAQETNARSAFLTGALLGPVGLFIVATRGRRTIRHRGLPVVLPAFVSAHEPGNEAGFQDERIRPPID